jgi:hypothetical protein
MDEQKGSCSFDPTFKARGSGDESLVVVCGPIPEYFSSFADGDFSLPTDSIPSSNISEASWHGSSGICIPRYNRRNNERNGWQVATHNTNRLGVTWPDLSPLLCRNGLQKPRYMMKRGRQSQRACPAVVEKNSERTER